MPVTVPMQARTAVSPRSHRTDGAREDADEHGDRRGDAEGDRVLRGEWGVRSPDHLDKARRAGHRRAANRPSSGADRSGEPASGRDAVGHTRPRPCRWLGRLEHDAAALFSWATTSPIASSASRSAASSSRGQIGDDPDRGRRCGSPIRGP